MEHIHRSLISRRGFVLGVGACGILTACGNGGNSKGSGNQLESDTVVFADYGGTTRTARTQAFLNPFSTDRGVRAVSANADPAKLELFVENERAEWDLIDMDGWDVDRFMRRDYLEKLSADVTRVDVVPEKYREYATGGYTASVGIGYRSDELETAPESWGHFFDTKAFPGKRAIPNFAYFMAEAALLADGASYDDLYPLDLDRAFARLESIRDDLLFYDTFGQGVQYLAQGSVSMVLMPNSRIAFLKDQGLAVDFTWNEAFFQWTAATIPKFAPHLDAAHALVDYMSQPETQAQFSRLTKYGPANSDALELLDETTKKQLPNAHLDVAYKVDNEGLSKDLDAYSERYEKWLAQG